MKGKKDDIMKREINLQWPNIQLLIPWRKNLCSFWDQR